MHYVSGMTYPHWRLVMLRLEERNGSIQPERRQREHHEADVYGQDWRVLGGNLHDSIVVTIMCMCMCIMFFLATCGAAL
jgi:hypothetical protein